MYNSIIVKYGEIGVKGKNRYICENEGNYSEVAHKK